MCSICCMAQMDLALVSSQPFSSLTWGATKEWDQERLKYVTHIPRGPKMETKLPKWKAHSTYAVQTLSPARHSKEVVQLSIYQDQPDHVSKVPFMPTSLLSQMWVEQVQRLWPDWNLDKPTLRKEGDWFLVVWIFHCHWQGHVLTVTRPQRFPPKIKTRKAWESKGPLPFFH